MAIYDIYKTQKRKGQVWEGWEAGQQRLALPHLLPTVHLSRETGQQELNGWGFFGKLHPAGPSVPSSLVMFEGLT